MMEEQRSITLPTEVWQGLDDLARHTNSVARRGARAGEPTWRNWLRRVGENKRLIERISNLMNTSEVKLNQETILMPSNPKTRTLARITIQNDFARVRFPEKRDDFRALVKSIDYFWEYPHWERRIDNLAGSLIDRAAELGHRLLAAGFCIVPPSLEVQDKIIMANYERECRRWVLAKTGGKYRGWFSILWRYGEDCYDAASKITGSKYSKPRVLVPPEHYEEVLDFAQMYHFRLTDAAQDLVKQARQLHERALIVAVAPIEEHTPVERPDFNPDEEVEIDDELIDDPL